MWQSIPAKDLSSSFKPLLALSKFICLIPFDFINEEAKVGVKYLIVLSAGCLFFILALCYHLCNMSSLHSDLPQKLRIGIDLHVVGVPVTDIVTLVHLYVHSGYIRNIFEKLSQIDERIEITQRNKIYVRTRSRLMRDVITASVFALLAYALNYFHNMDGKLLTFLTKTVENLNMTFGCILTLQLSTLVRSLQQRYLYFNEQLLECFKLKSSNNLSRYLENSKVRFINCYKCSTTTTEVNEVHKISVVRLMFIELYDSVGLINTYFGLPLLLFMLTSTISCVAYIYYYICLNASSFIYLFTAIFFSVLDLIICVLITTSCHNTVEEANRSAICVQRIKALSGLECGTVSELQKLSDQLREMRVEFSAWNFFRLDLSLLSMIISGVITYILLMIQLN